jgi:hypothetical protein
MVETLYDGEYRGTSGGSAFFLDESIVRFLLSGRGDVARTQPIELVDVVLVNANRNIGQLVNGSAFSTGSCTVVLLDSRQRPRPGCESFDRLLTCDTFGAVRIYTPLESGELLRS